MRKTLTPVEELEGRELDAAVAEEVMGWARARFPIHGADPFPCFSDSGDDVSVFARDGEGGAVWAPSTSIAAAWEAVRTVLLANPDWRFAAEPRQYKDGPVWLCEIKPIQGRPFRGIAANEPEAMSRAVLEAVRCSEL